MSLDFKNTRFSFSRSVLDYAKVQKLVGMFIRGRRAFVSNRACDYLNIGCGPNIFTSFYNLDYAWRPGIDACWDITRGLPFPDSTFNGCYTEHCMEHLSLSEFKQAIIEIRRVMRSGGHLRVVVPDAEIYIRGYLSEINGVPVKLPYQDRLVERTALMSINRVFRGHGHQYAWDYETIKWHLNEVGFIRVSRRKFREGADPNLLIDSKVRADESLYVEAIKE